MDVCRGIFIGLLLVGLAFGLEITINNPLVTVKEGGIADYFIIISNTDAGQNVNISVSSNIPVSVSDSGFYLENNTEKYVHVFAVAGNIEPGAYSIKFDVKTDKTYSYNLGLIVEEGLPSLLFNSVYDDASVKQGDSYYLRFNIRNEGIDKIKNIIITSDLPESFEPVYPSSFSLNAGESREASVKITVPSDYLPSTYDFTFKAASGDIERTASARITVVRKYAGPTGYFVFGGSFITGLLVVVIAVLLFFYVRQKSVYLNKIKEITSEGYLKKLVGQTKKELFGEKPKP